MTEKNSSDVEKLKVLIYYVTGHRNKNKNIVSAIYL